jgi:hypothetical protein
MEALILFIGLCALAFLSMRYGYDSRSAVHSKEEEYGLRGIVWDVQLSHLEDLRREAALWRINRHVAREPRRVRRRSAHALLALARWLDPELAPYSSGSAGSTT